MPRKKPLARIFEFGRNTGQARVFPGAEEITSQVEQNDENLPEGFLTPRQVATIRRRIARIQRKTQYETEDLLTLFQSYVLRKRHGHGVTQAELALITDISNRQLARIANDFDAVKSLSLEYAIRLIVTLGGGGPLYRVLGMGERGKDKVKL